MTSYRALFPGKITPSLTSGLTRALAWLLLASPLLASAEITELVIETRESLNGGASFGTVGAYQKLRGYARGELDPALPQNAVIVNLDKARRNASGRVEYRVDVEIHRPVSLAKGNGTLLYDVVNRGTKLAPYLSRMEDGFTFVWSGWQGDIATDGASLTATFPIARHHGETYIGLSREEFRVAGIGIQAEPTKTGFIVGALQYPAATLDRGKASLTVRQKERDPRQVIDNWRYIDERSIEFTPADAPFDAGALYEFIYPAKDPLVAGIGFAATRDVNSFLRFQARDRSGNANPLFEPTTSGAGGQAPGSGSYIKRALALGLSQSGRMLRDFLYLGFNRDEAGRKVFDGAMPVIAGARGVWANTAFSQPGRFSRQHEDHLQAGDQFPFSYPTTTDPLTGRRDGILQRCRSSDSCPKIAHVDGEFEIWQARGSLLVSDGNPAGLRAITMPDDVRLYMVAGTPHAGTGTTLPADSSTGICQNQLNPLDILSVSRAVLVALTAWITDGKQPPPSRYGAVSDGSLVTSDQASTGFPAIPGITYNGIYNSLRVTDYNAVPAAEGAEYALRVPRVDSSGNSLAGIRLPALEASIATYTGWNLRAAGYAENESCEVFGSYIPLAKTREERLRTGDPRLAIGERYASREDYVNKVAAAAEQLVAQRYLLAVDARAIVEEAGSVYDTIFPVVKP